MHSLIIYTNAIDMHVCLDLKKHIFIWVSFGKANEKFYFFISFIYFANEKI